MYHVRRAAVFVVAAAVAWVALYAGWGLVLLSSGGVEAIKDCRHEGVECTSLGEFTYGSSWPLVPVLLLVLAAGVGGLAARSGRRSR